MDREQAKRVPAGDVAVYRRARHRVVAVSCDGFWAPYFDLDADGMVSHLLVEAPAERLVAGPDEMPAERLVAGGEV